MAKFATDRWGQNPVRRLRPLPALAVSVGLAALCAGGTLPGARAQVTQTSGGQTTGNSDFVVNGNDVLFAMGFPYGYANYFATTPTAISLTGALYGYIRNNYIGVTVGDLGTFTSPDFSTATVTNGVLTVSGTVTHNVGGMISFGSTLR